MLETVITVSNSLKFFARGIRLINLGDLIIQEAVIHDIHKEIKENI